MVENILRSGRDPIADLAELIVQRQEAARFPLGHQLSTYATAPAHETAPECSYETADEHRFHDKAYATNDDAHSTDEDYTNDQSRYRRSSLVLLLAILGLAILGVAGAYGYRGIFGGPVLPTLAPTSKANKIAPVSTVLEAKSTTNTDQAGTTSTDSTENSVSREEQYPKPHVIRTIPITPDEGSLRGAAVPTPPGAVQINQAVPGSAMSVWPPPPAIAAPTAPTAAPMPAPLPQVLSEPKKTHSGKNRADQSGAADPRPEAHSPAAPIALGNPTSAAPMAASVSDGGYAVQVTSERNESNAQAALQALQVKYPNQLRGRQPIIRRVDLGAKGIYYRVLISPFASVDEAAGLCSRLKAAGGNCIVQRN
jgi:hypothetical protein